MPNPAIHETHVHPSYTQYLLEKVDAKNDRIKYLEQQIEYQKADVMAACAAAIAALAIMAIALYQLNWS